MDFTKILSLINKIFNIYYTKGDNNEKNHINFVTYAISTFSIKVGADISRNESEGLAAEKSEGMGITLGYEKMLLGLLGAGGNLPW